MTYTIHSYRKQHGAALITALSILLVLTILGIATVSTTVLQERMAGNARDYEVAFEKAETGLRAAEDYIKNTAVRADFNNTGGKFSKTYGGQAWEDDGNWSTASADSYQYIIQEIDSIVGAEAAQSLESQSYTEAEPVVEGQPSVFQVTVRGYGLSPKSRVMLQSYYGANID